jgi:hypothetical protein
MRPVSKVVKILSKTIKRLNQTLCAVLVSQKKNVVKPAGFPYFRWQSHPMVPGQIVFALKRIGANTET